MLSYICNLLDSYIFVWLREARSGTKCNFSFNTSYGTLRVCLVEKLDSILCLSSTDMCVGGQLSYGFENCFQIL